MPSGLTAIAEIDVNLAVVESKVSFEFLISLKQLQEAVLLFAQSQSLKIRTH